MRHSILYQNFLWRFLFHRPSIFHLVSFYPNVIGRIYVQRIEEALWGHNKKWNKYSLYGLCYRMWFLVTKCGILRGKSLFWSELSYFWYFMKKNEEPHPLHYVVMTIFHGKINPNRTPYGGFFRSANEILCPVGAISVYLFKR